MIHKLKSPFERLIAPICRFFIWAGISSNWITVIGFMIICLAALAFSSKEFIWAAIIMSIGGILDGVDGKIARDTNTVSRFGSFLDSSLDRVAEIALGAGILWSYRSTSSFELASFLVFLAITGSLMTSYVRARSQGIGFDCKEGFLQRPERGVIICVSGLMGHKALLWGVGIIAVFSYFTIIQRILTVQRATQKNPE